MSKINRLIKGVTSYPAVGEPLTVRLWDAKERKEKTYYLGHVWIDQREGQYLRPRETTQAANLDAINAVVAIKKG